MKMATTLSLKPSLRVGFLSESDSSLHVLSDLSDPMTTNSVTHFPFLAALLPVHILLGRHFNDLLLNDVWSSLIS